VTVNVTKTQYLFELKKDDDACKKVQQTGSFDSKITEHQYHSPLEFKKLLGEFEQNIQRIKDFVLIGYSEQHEAWCALGLCLSSTSSIDTSLKKLEMETKLKHDTHQFCSKSEQPTKKKMAGRKCVCPSNNINCFPQMAPVVITLKPALAGFCEISESLEKTFQCDIAESLLTIACHATMKPGRDPGELERTKGTYL
ncbi:Nucleoside diphosphate-linked moiety X motif 13, partial [Galemys pyrenaicus]